MIKYKKCSGICGKLLELNEQNFPWRDKNKKTFRNECKFCIAEYQKQYRKENEKEIAEKTKQYREENKEQLLEQKKQYYEDHREKILEQKKQYSNNIQVKKRKKENNAKRYIEKRKEILEQKKIYNSSQETKEKINKNRKKKRQENPKIKIRLNISNLIRLSFKKRGYKKNGSVSKYLSYTIIDLNNHIESFFEPWMNWHNYGRYNAKTWDDDDPLTWTWSLDHIIPHSLFNYTSMDDEEFKKCWALSNLRPYSSKQNILDGAKRIRHNLIE